MSSHLGANFLNSCVKVPIDPCNNCPAPVFNRTKIYLGRSSTSVSKIETSSKISDFDLDQDVLFATSGVRSLAKFYDSIPDYSEINHLPEDEFYSTLESLKSTCRHLKSKPSVPICLRNESSHSSRCDVIKPFKAKDTSESSSKCRKKRTTSRKSSAKKEHKTIPPSSCASSYRNLCEKMKILNYKEYDFDIEEISHEPIKSRREPTYLHKSLSVHHLPRQENHLVELESSSRANAPVTENPSQYDIKFQPRPNTPAIRESLRKSFSFNDLNSTYWLERSKKETAMKFKEYFDEKIKSPKINQEDVPNIIVQSPSLKEGSVKGSSCRSTASTGKKKSRKSKSESVKVPFSFLGINDCKLREKASSASPIHPVARPNLAATLRVEVSKKKVQELQSNCTFKSQTPQIDWEVRKTPAWKSLSLNESHQEILALRLATRKAEQELQKREYNLHMQLMRQRVKSAPLLLEGATFWGPHVGKLSHSCHKDSLKHTCQRGKKIRKKITNSKPQHRKCISNASYSRNSNHSTNLQDSDELSSLDRAYL